MQATLEDFSGRASEDELDAAVDLACRVIADDTARIKAEADQVAGQVAGLEQQAADVGWQISMLLDFTLGQLLDPPPGGQLANHPLESTEETTSD